MAQVGLKSFLHGELKDGKYKAPSKLAGAIEFKENLNSNDAKLYADDVLQDSDSSVTGGDITLGIDDDDPAIFGPLLGQKKNSIALSGGESKTVDVYDATSNDEPIAVGFGYISKKNGGKYKVVFYPKVKFAPYSVDAKTKEEKLEYTTPSVAGTIYPDEQTGLYRRTAVVESEADAVAALKALFTPTAE